MSHDTRAINRRSGLFADQSSFWLFGYGSLLHRADFPWSARRPARAAGWARRFWQGSHDHRGTPEAPGRVTTLVASDEICFGIAYRVDAAVLEALDAREKNGYLRQRIDLVLEGVGEHQALAYIAPPGNAAWLGPAPDTEIAAQIARARGPSGSNLDYLLGLRAALDAFGERDVHVEAIVAALPPGVERAERAGRVSWSGPTHGPG